jgi:hypothetical protein
MKDVYKQKIGDTISSVQQRVKIIHAMILGERPADPKQAEQYLREIEKGLESIQEIVDIS